MLLGRYFLLIVIEPCTVSIAVGGEEGICRRIIIINVKRWYSEQCPPWAKPYKLNKSLVRPGIYIHEQEDPEVVLFTRAVKQLIQISIQQTEIHVHPSHVVATENYGET